MRKRFFMVIVVATLIILGNMSQFNVCAAFAGEETRLTIATAGTEGVFYIYGGAIANVVSKYEPGLSITAEATGGSVENMKMIGNKQIDLATTSADVLYQAFVDYKDSKHFKKKIEVRALFNMYAEPIHILALANGNVNSISDIKGKRVAVGSPGSGTEVKAKMILHAIGIEYKDFNPEFLSFGEAAAALQDKNADAAFLGVIYPAPAVVSLALTNPIKLISLSDSELSKIITLYPFLSKAVIPGNVYKGVTQNTQTVSTQTLVVCRPDLPDDIAYKIVKAVFEHKKDLDQIHSSFNETTLANATPTLIPLHPGAIKYFKEKNVLK